MATSTKNSRPATGRKSMRGLKSGRGTTPAPTRRSALLSSKGLLGRVQATLPRAKRNVKQSGPQKLVTALGTATSRTSAHKPSTRSMLGILAGGIGAAAVAKRRQNPDPDELPKISSALADQADDSSQIPATVAEPAIDKGEHHGGPQGPDPAAAA